MNSNNTPNKSSGLDLIYSPVYNAGTTDCLAFDAGK